MVTSRSAVAAGLAHVVFWSAGFVGAELGTRDASGLDLLAWRYAVAGPLVLLVCVVVGVRMSRRALGRQAVLGLLNQVGCLGPLVLAVAHGVPAGTAALVASLQPMVVAVVAGRLLGERIGRLGVVGLAVGLAGVALVVVGDLAAGVGGPWVLGSVAGMLSLAAGTVVGLRWERTDPGSAPSLLGQLGAQTAVATLCFPALAVVAAGGAPAVPTTATFWLAVAWVVVLATFCAYGAYLFVLRQQGATAVSTWLYLSPPVTTLWAWLFLGQAPATTALAGMAVAAAGVVLVLRDRPDRPRRSALAAGPHDDLVDVDLGGLPDGVRHRGGDRLGRDGNGPVGAHGLGCVLVGDVVGELALGDARADRRHPDAAR